MSSNEKMKNKLVDTMRATKAGTSSTAETKKKAAPAVAKEKETPAKKKPSTSKKAAAKPAASGFSSGCRVWPD